MYNPTTHEEFLSKQIVDSAYTVHKKLGPGLLEKVYESCFCYELKKRNIPFSRQLTIPIIYDDLELEDALRMDVFVDKLIICELKAMDQINPVWQA
jgi:GxxExxY protein